MQIICFQALIAQTNSQYFNSPFNNFYTMMERYRRTNETKFQPDINSLQSLMRLVKLYRNVKELPYYILYE